MFTGIVRERGRIVDLSRGKDGARIVVEAFRTAADAAVGDSISISGCCLTAVAVDDGQVAFEAVPETLSRTTLGELDTGSEVNVEPALRAGEPLGGHYVQGHVDGVGRVRSVTAEGAGTRVWVEAPADVFRYCVEKGSIAIDGVSLTVAGLDDGAFGVALVPHTLAVTTLGRLEDGTAVNLEVDVLAKYVERLVR